MGPEPLTLVTTPATQPRRWALPGLVVGLCLVVLAVVLLVQRPTQAPAGASVPDAGTVQPVPGRALPTRALAAAAADPSPTSIPSVLPAPVASATTAEPAAPVPLPAPPTTAAGDPTSITVPSLGVTAAVLPVGIAPDGLMEVPSDVDTVGWYHFGPAPGDAIGSAVVTGHVDSADQGRGVFAELARLSPGDRVEVTGSDGVVRAFDVVARESWPKDEVPLGRLFERSGPGRLVLITCGGAFDPDALSYEENVAVTAVLVP